MTDAITQIQDTIEQKLAATLIEQMTADSIRSMVHSVMNEKTGNYYNSKPFFEKIIQDQIQNMLRMTIVKRVNEQEEVIKAAVEKVVSSGLVKAIADQIEAKLCDSLDFKITVKDNKDYED